LNDFVPAGAIQHSARSGKRCIEVINRDEYKNITTRNVDFFSLSIMDIAAYTITLQTNLGRFLLRTDTRLVFCNKKLMRTDIFFTRTTKPICNFANSIVLMFFLSLMYTYFTVLRCIISVKILINGLFSYWILLTKKNDHTLLLNFLSMKC
jgi:hypothetical protein